MERILGSVSSSGEGPTVVGIGGIHGNEPAGVRALEAVLEELARDGGGLVRGRFIAISGNRPALRSGVRFLDRDLNRIWVEGAWPADTEGREQADIRRVLDEIQARASGPLYGVDLHTTSGDAPPFAVLGDAPTHREFGRALPVPLVLGLTAEIEGTLLEYLDRRGWVTVGFESGSHAGEQSINMAVAAVWLLLGSLELLNSTDPRVRAARGMLGTVGEGLPRGVEVYHRHPVTPGVAFRMRPGFRSFQSIQEGELLAEEGGEEVRAPASGWLLMPLYQPKGEDGFFLTRTVPTGVPAERSPGLPTV